MEKTLKLLHKKYDKKNKNEYIKNQIKEMEKVFNFDKIPFSFKNDFDFYKNEILYYGILNKWEIEKSYKQAKILMEDYYEALDYEQKKRLMKYETDKTLKQCKYLNFEGINIVIPFFDIRMNEIYQNEMVLFDIKKYADLMLYYDHLIDLKQYAYAPYNSSFSSLLYISEQDDMCALYSTHLNRLYFLKAGEVFDFITIPEIKTEEMNLIAQCIYKNDIDTLIETLYTYKCIDEKIYKKLTKNRK